MKKLKQILAIAAIVLILGMYAAAFVFSMMKSEAAQGLFRGAIGATILVPVLLYLFLMVARAVKPVKSAVIDTIIFDAGFVLIDEPWEELAASIGLTEEVTQAIGRDVMGRPEWAKFDRGEWTRDEAYAFFAGRVPGHEEEVMHFLETLDDCFVPYWYSEDWIRSLKRKGYKVYILSNWSRESHDFLVKKGVFDLVREADGAVWSYACGLAKPDPAIYEHLLRTYRVDPSRAVFLDDNPDNVAAARKCGISAIRFRDYPDAEEKLASVGVRW